MTKEQLLEEAKRRYPVGTKFKGFSGEPITVIDSNHTHVNNGNEFISVSCDIGNGVYTKNGASVYLNGKWAEIISSPEIEIPWKPKVGDWAVIEKLSAYDKGKIGHVFQVDSIDRSNWIYATKETYIAGACWRIDDCRPARPEEIPQEEVEYVECTFNGFPSAIKGKIYPVKSGKVISENGDITYTPTGGGFKPSTREAYEAQERRKEPEYKEFTHETWKGEVQKNLYLPMDLRWKVLNKVSHINKKEDEYKDENSTESTKSIEVCGDGLSISRTSRARGKGLCSSGGEISLGAYNRRDKQKPCIG